MLWDSAPFVRGCSPAQTSLPKPLQTAFPALKKVFGDSCGAGGVAFGQGRGNIGREEGFYWRLTGFQLHHWKKVTAKTNSENKR